MYLYKLHREYGYTLCNIIIIICTPFIFYGYNY